MGIFEDFASGKYNLVLICILFIFMFHQYWWASSVDSFIKRNQDKITELMGELDINPQIKEAVRQQYLADVNAIRNLSEVATKLQKEGLTIPGNLIVTGALTVNGNGEIKGSFNYLPRGTIVSWTGTTAPVGWALCNGQNGTPNLQGRFVLGWNPGGGKHGKVPGADYNQLNGVGGNQVHRLTVGELAPHSHGMDQAGHHQHGFGVGGGGKNRGGGRGTTEGYTCNGCAFNTATDGAGNHTHGIHNAGGNEEHNIMPPYYILAFIMKI